MKELIFLEAFMKEIIWGGSRIKEKFSYKTNSDKIGEAWIVSANDNGLSHVSNGKFKGMDLKALWANHKEIFGKSNSDVFPLLIKYIDAKDDLSIQVHPDDEYAKKHENCTKGKAESWYIVDCEENSDIVIGHNAKNKEELEKMVKEERWNELLRFKKIQKGDFFDIPTGTVHAIRKGTLIFEVQQNSDITYRFYDYDRLQNGKKRELHIQKSLDVTKCPHEDSISQKENYLIYNEFYSIKHHVITKELKMENKENFAIICILDGFGKIGEYDIKKGDNFIIPANFGSLNIQGNLEIMEICENINES